MLVISISSFAQSSKGVGKLSGLVLDEMSAVIIGAKIIIEGKNFRREIKSNDEGYFEILLPKGEYKIRVPEENGFYGSTRKQFYINRNKSFRHNIVLKGIRQDVDHP